MNKKKIIGFSVSLGTLLLILVGAVVAFFIIKPYESKKKVYYSDEFLKYNEIYYLELDKERNEYYILGLKQEKINKLDIPKTIDNIPVTKIICKEDSFSSFRQVSEVVISKNIKYIGVLGKNDSEPYRDPFLLANGISRFTVDPENEYFSSVDGVLYSKDGKKLLRYPNAKDFGLGYIEFVIPDEVELIEQKAFYICDSLESVIFGKNVKTVSFEAFYNCENLENIELNNGLISLAKDSFRDCESLSAITLPESLEIAEAGCFKNCKKLRHITILGENPTLEGAFSGITSQKVDNETLEGEVSEIYFEVPSENKQMILNFGSLEYVKSIGIYGLENVYAKAFIFLNGIKGKIDEGKIVYQNENSEGFLKYSEEFLKYNEIYYLHLDKERNEYYILGLKQAKINKLVIPETIDNIPVTKIICKEDSFSSFRQVSEVVISKNIKYIGVLGKNDSVPYRDPFLLADGISRFTVDPENEHFSSVDGVLYSKDGKILLRYPNAKDFGLGYIEFVIPDEVEHIEQSAFYICDSLESVIFGKNVKTVSFDAFYNCENLENIELNNGLISLAKDSFRDCESLSAITLPESLKIVEAGCFKNCKKLLHITILGENLTLEGAFSGIISQKVDIETLEGEVSNIYFYVPSENKQMILNFGSLEYVKSIGIYGLENVYAKAFIFLNNIKGKIDGDKIIYPDEKE